MEVGPLLLLPALDLLLVEKARIVKTLAGWTRDEQVEVVVLFKEMRLVVTLVGKGT